MKKIKTEIDEKSANLCSNNDLISGNPDRPIYLSDYIGQESICKNLKTSIKAAKIMNKSLGHILFCGPPGLGKTTLANIVANEMGVKIKTINGPNIERQGELAALLSSLNDGDILFIDEIHRLPKFIEEILYSAMEDYRLDIIIGEGQQSKSISLNLPKFTLIGATTKTGIISKPLKDRFQMIFHMEYYTEKELGKIIKKVISRYNIKIESGIPILIASYCRETPRIAIHIVKRIMDYAIVNELSILKEHDIKNILLELGYYEDGLTNLDIKYINYLRKTKTASGLKTIASYLGETPDSIEQDIESYLIRKGYVIVTPRGRLLREFMEEENRHA